MHSNRGTHVRRRHPTQFTLRTAFAVLSGCGILFGFIRDARLSHVGVRLGLSGSLVCGLLGVGALCLFTSLAISNRAIAEVVERAGLTAIVATVVCVLVLFLAGPLLVGPASDLP